jgi:hypothetical protein
MSRSKFGRLIAETLKADSLVQERGELFKQAMKIKVSPEIMRQAAFSSDRAKLLVERLRSEAGVGKGLLDGSANRLALQIGRDVPGMDRLPGIDLAELSKSVAVLSESLEDPSASWRKDLLRRIEEVPTYQPMLEQMQKATAVFVQGQRDLDDRADEFVVRHGWPLPLRLQPRLFGQIVRHAGASKREVNAMMIETFRPGTRAYGMTREVLLESPHFQSRRVLLGQAIKAFRREEWYLVISALLPLVEGVLVDVVYADQTAPKKGRPEKSLKRLQTLDEELVYAPLVRGLEVMLIPSGAGIAIFANFTQSDYGHLGEPRVLNRNAILHGAARRYGSRQNALKLYLLLVMLAELLQYYDEIGKRAARQARS